MTTIVYRAGVMAGDREAVFQNRLRVQIGAPKIAKDSSGVLYGVCGDWPTACRVLDAVKLQAQTDKVVHLPIPGKNDDFEILIAYPDGRIRHLAPEGEANFDDCEYFAIGNGRDIAFGALFAGAGAIGAVEAARHHSVGTGGEIDSIYHPASMPRSRGNGGLAGKGYLGDRPAIQVEDVYREMAGIAEENLKRDITATGIDRVGLAMPETEDPEAAFDRIANAKD